MEKNSYFRSSVFVHKNENTINCRNFLIKNVLKNGPSKSISTKCESALKCLISGSLSLSLLICTSYEEVVHSSSRMVHLQIVLPPSHVYM